MVFPSDVVTSQQKAIYLLKMFQFIEENSSVFQGTYSAECIEACKRILVKVGEKPTATDAALFKQLFNKNLKLNAVLNKIYSDQVKISKPEGCVVHTLPGSDIQYLNSNMSNYIEVVPHNCNLIGVTHQKYPLSIFNRFYYSEKKNELILYISLPLILNSQYSEKLIVFSESIFLWKKTF